jgi:hypothetical protein
MLKTGFETICHIGSGTLLCDALHGRQRPG